jgi:hypothetical protein
LLIFIFGGQPTPDVPFLLVLIQYLPDLQIQSSVAFWQPNLQVFVNGGL